MTTIAQDAAARADIKEDRKTTTPAPTETTPATEAAPAPVSAKAKKEPAKTVSKEQTKKEPAKTVSKEQTKKEPVKPKPATAKEPVKKPEVKPVAEPFKLPKPLSGAAPIYMLFATKRQDNVADNRRHESLNNLQEQLFLGVSVDKTILETAKANYTKEFPHLYFWISTKKVLGEMPKDLGLALQIENVLIARGKM